MAENDFEDAVVVWRMENHRTEAKEWYDACQQKYHSVSLLVPWKIDGVRGMLLASSNRESTRIMHTDERKDRKNRFGRMISDPYWKYYDVWWYAGLELLNFSGIIDPAYEGRLLRQQLGPILACACDAWEVEMWKYCYVYFGVVEEKFGELLRALGIHAWCKLVC